MRKYHFVLAFVLLGLVLLPGHQAPRCAQGLYDYTTVELPDGTSKAIYQLVPGVAGAVEAPATSSAENFARWRGYRWCTFERIWFALPIETAGYYVIAGAPNKYVTGGFDRIMLGVYRERESITQPGMVLSDVVKFPTNREFADTYILRGEPGQVWFTQLLSRGGSEPKTLWIGARAAQKLATGQKASSSCSPGLPVALYELDLHADFHHEIKLEGMGGVNYDLYVMRVCTPTAVRVVKASASKPKKGAPNSDSVTFLPRPEETYLALIKLTSGEGSYQLSCNPVAAPGE